MAKQLTISVPDNHYDFLMGLFNKFKVEILSNSNNDFELTNKQKEILDQRLLDYQNNPSNVTNWDDFLVELENEI